MRGNSVLLDIGVSDPDSENDPGNGGLLALNGKGIQIVHMTSVGSETRTINNPTKAGAILILTVQTHGGNIAVTFASAIQGSNAIATFTAVGGTLMVVACRYTTGFRWRFIGGTSVTMS